MPAIEVEDRAAVREDRTQPRLLLAHRFKPARDRAVVRTFLRTLGVACAEADLGAPVEAPIDVQFPEQLPLANQVMAALPVGRPVPVEVVRNGTATRLTFSTTCARGPSIWS